MTDAKIVLALVWVDVKELVKILVKDLAVEVIMRGILILVAVMVVSIVVQEAVLEHVIELVQVHVAGITITNIFHLIHKIWSDLSLKAYLFLYISNFASMKSQ